jgi:hypothetical protein
LALKLAASPEGLVMRWIEVWVMGSVGGPLSGQ